MSKYLTKAQVVADFKLNVLPNVVKEIGNDMSIIQHCWDISLEQLLDNKAISDSQKNKWKITANELDLSD